MLPASRVSSVFRPFCFFFAEIWVYGVFSRDVTASMLVSLNKEQRACWCTQLILWEFNSILMQTLSFVLLTWVKTLYSYSQARYKLISRHTWLPPLCFTLSEASLTFVANSSRSTLTTGLFIFLKKENKKMTNLAGQRPTYMYPWKRCNTEGNSDSRIRTAFPCDIWNPVPGIPNPAKCRIRQLAE